MSETFGTISYSMIKPPTASWFLVYLRWMLLDFLHKIAQLKLFRVTY